IQAGFLYFTRLTFTFLALLIVTAKGLGIILLALVLPVIHFITGNFNKIMDRLNFYYPRILSSCLKNDGGVIAVILALFALSIFVVAPQLGSELIPEVHQGSLHVNINLPVGTPVENTDALLQGISKKISALPLVSEVGYFAGTTKDELSEKEVGEHIGKITLNISKEGNVKENELSVMRGIRGLLKGFTDMDYNIESPVLFTMKPPIEVVLKAYNLELLRKVAGDVFKKLSQVEGLKDIQNSVRPGFPELVITFQRMKLSYYGLNAFDVASLIKNKIDGFVATKFKEKDRRVDIRVYLKDDQRRRAENIKNLIINPGGAVPIRLSSVADVNIVSGPNEIRRVDQDRSAVISANISGIDLKSAVAKIHTIINAYPMPPGFNYVVSGQSKEMETSLNSLIMALLLAIFLVYIVMASQFESFLHPFMILFTIPMALIGVLCVLYVFNIPLSVFVYIGMITLVGIVVNNAIVLIDYINVLRKRGVEKMEAIKQAGKIRMRPILITTSTTVLGLLPMAMGMGEGSEIRTPMAISVIAGLLSATFLTLVLIPIVYNRFSK
ncbi:MAG: efflux RND transporter permease subunit, partial [bacterium]|nr:efflux RND transporter permease subunit [bacterium]